MKGQLSMQRVKMVFSTFLILAVGTVCCQVSSASAGMVKEVAVGVFSNAVNQTDLDRFYLRHHGPEVVKFSGAWLRLYQLWNPFEPPEEAVERFGAVRGRYAELWYSSGEEYLDRPAHGPMKSATFETEGPSKQTVVMVPAKPTEEFFDPDPHPEDTPILRWLQVMAYPEGVSLEEGEDWFLNVHAKEALKQPGLIKFVSYRVLTELGEKMLQEMMKSMKPIGMETAEGGSPPSDTGRKTWVRVNEYWYKDFNGWREAVVESPPEYTTPGWGGEYPYVEMVSTFLPYMHDVDFLKGNYIVP
jgi:hypothetical protein